jgi:hypothetical protein
MLRFGAHSPVLLAHRLLWVRSLLCSGRDGSYHKIFSGIILVQHVATMRSPLDWYSPKPGK